MNLILRRSVILLRMGKEHSIVIYTVLVGDYDTLNQPYVTIPGVDYICFVKSKTLDFIGIWKIVEIGILINNDIRLSRFPKILPHETLLRNYEYSLYIDANIIISDMFVYERIKELIKNQTKLSLIKHPARNCAYQEIYNCIAGCKASWTSLIRQFLFLKYKKYPQNCGLYEANLIFRKHNDIYIRHFDNLWWNTYVRFSTRDQMSLAYALYKERLDFCYFVQPPFSTTDHPAFKRLNHKKKNMGLIITLKKAIICSIIKPAKFFLKDSSNI